MTRCLHSRSEQGDDRTHNDVNEITGRDTDDNGTDNHTLTYFKTGAMKNDGQHYKYIWDAWGRLRKVRNRGNNNLVTEYRYNGLGFRITETYDTDTSGTVDGSDSIYHFVYDERWRIVATYREDDADPKEIFVHHAAGNGGYGTSSYIDAVILRDVDLSTDWDAQADALDTRHYYCQNWRADVSVILDDSAVLVERIMYSPYGVPFGIPVGDIVSSGGSEPASGTVGGPDINAMSGYLGSSYNIADLDNDGDVDSADQTIQSNNNGATIGWTFLSDTHNRLGYAGYVFDEALTGTKWHVRHRVLESVLGRWISRDPLGYVDGPSLVQYAIGDPISNVDHSGNLSNRPPKNVSPWWNPLPYPGDLCDLKYRIDLRACNVVPAGPLRNACIEQANLRYQICNAIADAPIDAPTILTCLTAPWVPATWPFCSAYPPCWSHYGVNFRCMCMCMGNDPWSRCVRGCIQCGILGGAHPFTVHLACWAHCSLLVPEPKFKIAACGAACFVYQQCLCGPGYENYP